MLKPEPVQTLFESLPAMRAAGNVIVTGRTLGQYTDRVVVTILDVSCEYTNQNPPSFATNTLRASSRGACFHAWHPNNTTKCLAGGFPHHLAGDQR